MRYLGNKSTKEVHDTHNEQSGCNLALISQAVHFATLERAQRAGFDGCGHCLPSTSKK